MILKSDNEPSILALRKTIRQALPEIEVLEENSPPGDHQANGLAEAGVREVKRQMRAIRFSTEEQLHQRIPDDHPVLAWLPRLAAIPSITIEQELTGFRPNNGGQAEDGGSLLSSFWRKYS